MLILAEKDIRIQLRTKEAIFSTFLFVVLTLFILNFSTGTYAEIVNKLAPGVIWIVITFSGTIAISHVSYREQEDRSHEGILMAGCGGGVLFFSRFLTALVFMLWIELITVPLFMVFFNFSFGDWFLLFAMILSLGTIGYAAVGTLFAGLLSQARFRDLLFPVVFYPVVIPLLIGAVKATSVAMTGETPREVFLLIGFDLIFVTASALLYDFVVEDPS